MRTAGETSYVKAVDMSATDAQSDAQRLVEAEVLRDIARRVLAQRVSRYGDPAPDLAPVGSARFRHDGRRLLVGYAVAHPGMATALVQRVQEYAHRRDMHIMWLVTPQSPGEEEMPAALRTEGFKMDEQLILMGRRGAIHTSLNREARIELVTSYDGMRAYEHGSRRSFYDDDTPDDRMVASRAADRWRQQEQGWYRYYLVTLRNRIVGGCYVTLWEDIPTLMGVYTAPEVRGMGIASTLLSYVTGEIVRSGRDPYCLYVKTDNPARRLYERLGFEALTTDETYLSPNQPHV